MRIFLFILFTVNSYTVLAKVPSVAVDHYFLEIAMRDMFKNGFIIDNVAPKNQNCHNVFILKPSEINSIKKSDYYLSLTNVMHDLSNHNNVNICESMRHVWLNINCTISIYNRIISILKPKLSQEQINYAHKVVNRIEQTRDAIVQTVPQFHNKIYTEHNFSYEISRDKIIKISGYIFDKHNNIKPSLRKLLVKQSVIIITSKNFKKNIKFHNNTKIIKIDSEFYDVLDDKNCAYCMYILDIYKKIENQAV